MHRSIWTYAWDLLDIGYDAALGEIRDRAGANSVSLATSYHAGRFVQPRSPKRKVYFPEDGTIYFHPTPARWEGLKIQPKVAEVIVKGGDVLRELVRRRDAGGLKVCCWTVCLHNTRLGMLHPEAVTLNAFGDPNYYNLCPSNPDARAYVVRPRRGPDPFVSTRYRRAREPVLHGVRARVSSRQGWRRLHRGGRVRDVALLLRVLPRARKESRRRWRSGPPHCRAMDRRGLRAGGAEAALPRFSIRRRRGFPRLPGGPRISHLAHRTGDQPRRRDQGARAWPKPRRPDR